jgi:hypothetical protein
MGRVEARLPQLALPVLPIIGRLANRLSGRARLIRGLLLNAGNQQPAASGFAD